MTKRRVLWIAIAIVAFGIALGWYLYGPRTVPPGQPQLATLHPAALDGFREEFNRAAGQVRVVILLSPT